MPLHVSVLLFNHLFNHYFNCAISDQNVNIYWLCFLWSSKCSSQFRKYCQVCKRTIAICNYMQYTLATYIGQHGCHDQYNMEQHKWRNWPWLIPFIYMSVKLASKTIINLVTRSLCSKYRAKSSIQLLSLKIKIKWMSYNINLRYTWLI